jgi:hypothetical protein
MKILKEMNSVGLIWLEAIAPGMAARKGGSAGTAMWAGLAGPAHGHNRLGWPMLGGAWCLPEPWSMRSDLAWRRGHHRWYKRRRVLGKLCENKEGKRDALGNKGATEAHQSAGSMWRRRFGPAWRRSWVAAPMWWSSTMVRGSCSFGRSVGFHFVAQR